MDKRHEELKYYNVCLLVSILDDEINAKKQLDDICRSLFVNYSITNDLYKFKVLISKSAKHANDAYWAIYYPLNRVLLENIENYTIELTDITEITLSQFNDWKRLNSNKNDTTKL